MIIRDNRGKHRVAEAEKNRLLIWGFYEENSEATQRECAEKLGFSIVTVNQHVKAIREGWRPQAVGAAK